MATNTSSLATARLKRMSYALLPGNGKIGDPGPHNVAYQLWKSCWQQTYSDLQTTAKLKADDFTRHDIISVLYDGSEAVSLLLHTHYNLGLEAIRDHSYLSPYPAEVVARLQAEGHSSVLSFEYLTLSPRWRKTTVGAPTAKVICGLGVKIAAALGLSSIAVTRVDRGVNRIFADYGARLLAPNLTMHNVAVDLMKLDFREICPNPDPEVDQVVELLWQSRKDQFGLERIKQEKKAA